MKYNQDQQKRKKSKSYSVEIIFKGIDVVGIMHMILQLYQGNLRERGIEEPRICTSGKKKKSKLQELESGRRKENNVCVIDFDI